MRPGGRSLSYQGPLCRVISGGWATKGSALPLSCLPSSTPSTFGPAVCWEPGGPREEEDSLHLLMSHTWVEQHWAPGLGWALQRQDREGLGRSGRVKSGPRKPGRGEPTFAERKLRNTEDRLGSDGAVVESWQWVRCPDVSCRPTGWPIIGISYRHVKNGQNSHRRWAI